MVRLLRDPGAFPPPRSSCLFEDDDDDDGGGGGDDGGSHARARRCVSYRLAKRSALSLQRRNANDRRDM